MVGACTAGKGRQGRFICGLNIRGQTFNHKTHEYLPHENYPGLYGTHTQEVSLYSYSWLPRIIVVLLLLWTTVVQTWSLHPRRIRLQLNARSPPSVQLETDRPGIGLDIIFIDHNTVSLYGCGFTAYLESDFDCIGVWHNRRGHILELWDFCWLGIWQHKPCDKVCMQWLPARLCLRDIQYDSSM